MAKYRVGPERAYIDGRLYNEGDVLTRPDDERPSQTFYPLDDAGRAAMEKHWPKRWKQNAPATQKPVAEQPRTMSEMQGGRSKRAADREPV